MRRKRIQTIICWSLAGCLWSILPAASVQTGILRNYGAVDKALEYRRVPEKKDQATEAKCAVLAAAASQATWRYYETQRKEEACINQSYLRREDPLVVCADLAKQAKTDYFHSWRDPLIYYNDCERAKHPW